MYDFKDSYKILIMLKRIFETNDGIVMSVTILSQSEHGSHSKKKRDVILHRDPEKQTMHTTLDRYLCLLKKSDKTYYLKFWMEWDISSLPLFQVPI